MGDSGKYFQPELLSRIPQLRLRAKQVVEGFLAGEHRGTTFGHSSEFHQHREYAPGDDPRFIDWKVWGRQDRFYVRQQQIETNRRFLAMVDHSRSMAYRGASWSKYDHAATLAVSLAWLATVRGDAAGCLPFRSCMTQYLPFKTGRDTALEMADLLERCQPVCETNETPAEETDIGEPLRYVATHAPRGTLVAILSDCLVDTESLVQGLDLLMRAGHEVFVFQILDDYELDFPFDDRTRFVDLETQLSIRCDPRTVREHYRELIGNHTALIRKSCLKRNSRYGLLRTSLPLDAALSGFFASNRRW